MRRREAKGNRLRRDEISRVKNSGGVIATEGLLKIPSMLAVKIEERRVGSVARLTLKAAPSKRVKRGVNHLRRDLLRYAGDAAGSGGPVLYPFHGMATDLNVPLPFPPIQYSPTPCRSTDCCCQRKRQRLEKLGSTQSEWDSGNPAQVASFIRRRMCYLCPIFHYLDRPAAHSLR